MTAIDEIFQMIKNNRTLEVQARLEASPKLLQERGFWHRTPLHVAAYSGNIKLVKFCLDNGADVHAMDACRHTLLHLAALEGHFDIVKLGLEAHIDPCVESMSGEAAVDFAHMEGHKRIEDLLIQSGSRPYRKFSEDKCLV
eukprot:TRINITY_DN9088_c0_g1_i1.p1 TRINITY_DN9088_c0_g1~~TRINITY_DN9088_c0_g1_i1.p1  ORF type:complete len:141 (+),score=23.51 TRINITY_DN9088_c0_g1_i1:140-562(+)